MDRGSTGRLTRVAAWLSALTGWRRILTAFLIGACAALALPPIHAVPLAFVAFTGLIWLLDGAGGGRTRFLIGWAFGLGYFVTGLYWTGLSMLVDAGRFAAFLPLAILGLPSVLAIYSGLATLAAGWIAPHGPGRVAALAATWTAAEFLRGTLFTGFPWNAVGYMWSVTDGALQVASLIGVLGLTAVTVWVAAAPALLINRPIGNWQAAGAAGLSLALLMAGYGRLVSAPSFDRLDYADGVRLRVVQPNIPQKLKWHRDHRDRNLMRHVQLSTQPAEQPVTHVIWPEAAIPFFIGNDATRRQIVASIVPPGGQVLTGVPRRSPSDQPGIRIWNSLVGIDERANTTFTYDKEHLVPFGEYLPLRSVLSSLGLDKLAVGAVDYSSGARGLVPVKTKGLPPFRALICYEAIFPDEIAGRERPAWLLNVTNDAWFGDSSGPYQHFAMTRMRAVEQGLPLVRAANTGISALVDPYGRVMSRLGIGVEGVIDGNLPNPLTHRPLFLQGGRYAWIAMVVFLIFVSVFARKTMKYEDI